MSTLCRGGLDPALRTGLVMCFVCPPPLPLRSLATRSGLKLSALWLAAVTVVAKALMLAQGAALTHGIVWFSNALGIALLAIGLAPAAGRTQVPCVWRCFTLMVVLLQAGLMSAPWMLGCAVLMRLDVLRPHLALSRRANLAAAACLALGIA